MLSGRALLASAHAREKVLGLLEHPPPQLGGLSRLRLLLAALEVQDGGPAHYQSACVADGPGGRPATHRHELQDLTVERPEAEACGQHPGELPYDGVLTGVLADDLLAHRAPEGGVTAPQRDQVLLVQGASNPGRELPKYGLLGYGRKKGHPRVLDGLARKGYLDAAVPGLGDGDEDLSPHCAPTCAQQSRQPPGLVRFA